MSQYSLEEVVPITLLAEAFGGEVLLSGKGSDSGPFRVLAEFEAGGKAYAVLQSESMRQTDEVELFHIGQDEQGELQLTTVENDDEWEDILELYDEMTVSFD